jgi:plasmid stabilization system protein ParE
MSLPVTLRPEAQDDLLAARDWYEQQRAGLGDSFAAAVDEVITRIEAVPELHAVVLEDVRRGKVRKYPSVVYHRVLADRVEVIGVLHTSRDPRVWQERVE